MADCLKCQISPLGKYRQNQKPSFHTDHTLVLTDVHMFAQYICQSYAAASLQVLASISPDFIRQA